MNNRIIICETSEIITAGLTEIIHNMAGFDVVMRLDTPDRLSERILSSDANVLIINLLKTQSNFNIKLSDILPTCTY